MINNKSVWFFALEQYLFANVQDALRFNYINSQISAINEEINY